MPISLEDIRLGVQTRHQRIPEQKRYITRKTKKEQL